MDSMTMTPSRRLDGQRAYGHAAEAFDTVAWRAPDARRFDTEVANDLPMPPRTVARQMPSDIGDVPRWLIVVGGGFAAALMGALLGGALQV